VGHYVAADAPVPDGKILLRDLGAGELVPTSALGAPGDVDVQRVTVRADAVSTAGLDRGQRVDVYVTPGSARTLADPSESRQTTRLLQSVAVVDVLASEGGFGATTRTSVQLYVPADKVREVVEAVDHEAKVTLVPVRGAPAGAGGA
jgi:hypothetical protein